MSVQIKIHDTNVVKAEDFMSELVVFKANDLAVSRYDLTEHETKLVLCCVAMLNPTLDGMDRARQNVTSSSRDYAGLLSLSTQSAW